MIETVPSALAGERIDRVVSMLTGRSRADVAALIADGAVRIDDRVVTSRSRRTAEGDVVSVDLPDDQADSLEPDERVLITVAHVDEHLIVVDKPAGIVVYPGAGTSAGTLVHGLLARYPQLRDVGAPDRPGIVHRLDKETSGLLLVARTTVSYERLVDLLATRQVHRAYRALVWGQPSAAAGVVDAPIGRSAREPTRMAVSFRGKEARTRYEVVATYDDPVAAAELACTLETGRTHQIRVHLASIGHPVLGDRRYGGSRESFRAPRPRLHAERLELVHPVSGEPLAFESALPADFLEVRARLA